MLLIGKINKDIYKCITDDIMTDELIITDNHIKARHPNIYETFADYLREAINSPDYIIKDKHPNTGLVIKQLYTNDHRNVQIVLRICTSKDEPGYKNSIISFWEISESRLQNYLKNKRFFTKKNKFSIIRI